MTIQSALFADARDVALLSAIAAGLPICERPYQRIAGRLQMSEDEVIARLQAMTETGIIKRFGLVLHHRALGYKANAMVVFDVPDADVDAVAARITAHDFVTLCYCRVRRAPVWPYNLYCMIHGRERAIVEGQIARLKQAAGLARYASTTLFSLRRFKQTGAHFAAPHRQQVSGP